MTRVVKGASKWFRVASRGLDIHFTWYEFNAAHAFLRDEGSHYDPELALRAYGMAVDLFRRKLGAGDQPHPDVKPTAPRVLL